MSTITCPYCFAKFKDNKVHFRSERVSRGVNPHIPDDFDDFDDFELNYKGNNKSQILDKCKEWEFFKEGEDSKYTGFWKRYGGTTTEEITPNKPSYRNKVIDPSDPEHQKYLKKVNGQYLNLVENFTTNITLKSGELCTQRVCPECHNPLPNQYGKNDVRFIAVIGVTGAGKTVYLSQLIYGFEDYVVKAGLAALLTTDNPLKFVRNNAVKVGQALPGSTPPGNFLQPLFYDLSKKDEAGNNQVYTLVIYDVAGENCDIEKVHSWFGPFIQHMNGVFLLIDPMQFKAIKGMSESEEDAGTPMKVLHAIHNYIMQGKSGKCEIPLAVCISKSDMQQVQSILSDSLADALMDPVEPTRDATGKLVAKFNATQYNPIAMEIQKFMQEKELALENFVDVNYSCYNYFAFTSLGCDVKNNVPEGPIMPKRIEEPLLWLFSILGFIGTTEPIEGGSREDLCPKCGKRDMRKKLFGEERKLITKKSKFLKKALEWEEYDYYCERCNEYYNKR